MSKILRRWTYVDAPIVDVEVVEVVLDNLLVSIRKEMWVDLGQETYGVVLESSDTLGVGGFEAYVE